MIVIFCIIIKLLHYILNCYYIAHHFYNMELINFYSFICVCAYFPFSIFGIGHDSFGKLFNNSCSKIQLLYVLLVKRPIVLRFQLNVAFIFILELVL